MARDSYGNPIPRSPTEPLWKTVVKWTGGILAIVAIFFVAVFGIWSGAKVVNRYNKRADVRNEVTVRNTQARVARAEVQVAVQRAEVRYQESVGIKRAQVEIAKTLTPLYVQHEAIEAQIQMSHNGAATQVYIPSGAQGVPLVATTPPAPALGGE